VLPVSYVLETPALCNNLVNVNPPVGSHHKPAATREQPIEKLPQDHCICHVRDMQLVEAQQLARSCHLTGDGRKRVLRWQGSPGNARGAACLSHIGLKVGTRGVIGWPAALIKRCRSWRSEH